jgi:sugar lactone lactonase YvrE
MTTNLDNYSSDQEALLVADYACETGENPLWHPIEQRLYWTDIPNGRLFRYDPFTDSHEQCYEGRPVGGFTVQHDGSLLLFMDQGTVAVLREGMPLNVIDELSRERKTRFNDVIADPEGRVFCGTMSGPDGEGRLYRMDIDGTIEVILENVKCSNGMAFSADHRSFFHTDSFARQICKYDYDERNGSIRNRQVFAEFSEADGFPDGMTIDADGQVWSALWDGGRIVRFGENGAIEDEIRLPTKKISSLSFGGKDYAEIYITSAGGDSKCDNGPTAGGLFRVKGKSRGRPEFLSRVQVP